MGKIDKVLTSRHMSTMSPAIKKFIETAGTLSIHQLPAHLDSFPRVWSFSRGDLYHWIPLLNRFDLILQTFLSTYGLNQGPQTVKLGRLLRENPPEGTDDQPAPESPQQDDLAPSVDDKVIVLSILSFTRLLLDNCSNRILYSSKEHINRLLYSTDLDIVVTALKVGLQVARRYHDLRIKTHHSLMVLGLDIDNLYHLATPFSRLGTPSMVASPSFLPHSSDLLAIVNDVNPENAHLVDWAQVSISGRDKRRLSFSASPKTAPGSQTPPISPSPSRRHTSDQIKTNNDDHAEGTRSDSASSGLVVIPSSDIKSLEGHELVKTYIHLVPKEMQFDFLYRVNLAKAIHGDKSAREAIVSVRLLATAILAYAEKDSSFDHRLGQADAVEPRAYQIAFQLGNLLQFSREPGREISYELQTVAVNSLEALCFQRNKAQDICNALMVSQSHGPLFIAIRHLLQELSEGTGLMQPKDVDAERWRDSLLVLLGEIPSLSSTSTGDHLLSAGIMHPLLELLKLRTLEALRSQPRILIFLDNLMYSSRDSFSSLAEAGGLQIIAQLANYCVETSIEDDRNGHGFDPEYASTLTDYTIPYFKQQALKWLLKFVIHRMNARENSGARHLRNLMDIPSLLASLKTILMNGKLFGTMIWSWTANLVHVFINNEPTSYNVIAEAGLSKSIVESIICHPLSGSDVSWHANQQSSENAPENSEFENRQPPTLNIGWIPFEDLPTIRLGRQTSKGEPPGRGVMVSSEVMATVLDVLSTLCLNEGGLKMVSSSGSILAFSEIFESLEHVKSLDLSLNNSANIGKSLDHFARHHQSLQDQIFEAIHAAVFNVNQVLIELCLNSGYGSKLLELGQNGDRVTIVGGRLGMLGSVGVNRIKRLLERSDLQPGSDVEKRLKSMIENEGPLEFVKAPDASDETKNILMTISLLRVVITFFSRAEHCFQYMKRYGVDEFLDLALHPSLGPSYSYRVKDQLSTLENRPSRIISTLASHKPHLVIPSLLHRLKNSAIDLQPFLGHDGTTPFFDSYLSGEKSSLDISERQNGSTYVKALQTVYNLGLAFAGLFRETVTSRQTQNPVSLFNAVDGYVQMIDFLMALQSSALWEDLILEPAKAARWTQLAQSSDWVFSTPRMLGLIGGNELEFWKEAPEITKLLPWDESHSARFGSESSPAFQNFALIRYLLTNCVAIVTPMLRLIIRIIQFGRFSHDSVLETRLFPIIATVANGFRLQLKHAQDMRAAYPDAYYPYLSVILRSLHMVLFDDIQTEIISVKYIRLLLICRLKDEGCFNMMLDLLQDLISEYEPPQKSEANGKEKKSPADNPIECCLWIILAICRNVTQFNGWAMQENEASFNSPRYFLEIRTMMLEACLKLWTPTTLLKLSTESTKSLAKFAKALFEVRVDEKSFTPPFIKESRLKAPPSQYFRDRRRLGLLADEFGEDLALEALFRCHDDVASAKEYCQFVKSGFSQRFEIPEGHLQQYLNSDPSLFTSSSRKNKPCYTPAIPEFAMNNSKSSREPTSKFAVRFNALRQDLRTQIIDNIIEPLHSHNGIENDISQLIFKMVASKRDDAEFCTTVVETIVHYLLALKPDDLSSCTTEHAKKISTTAHLLGLALRDSALQDIALSKLKEGYDDLLVFVSVMPVKEGEEPVLWIAQILLIVEAMLSHDAQPSELYLSSELQYENLPTLVIPEIEAPVQFLSKVQKRKLLDSILTILPKLSKDEVTNLSVVRILSLLSRDTTFAAILGEKHNIRKLFLMVRQMNGAHHDQFKIVFMLILRHIIEDEDTIRQLIRADIIDAYYNANPLALKLNDLAHNRSRTLLRNPDLFVEVASKYLTFMRYDGPPSATLAIKNIYFNQPTEEMKRLKEELDEDLKKEVFDIEDRDAPISEARPPKHEGVIHYLLCELLAYKDVKEAVHKEKTEPEQPTESEPTDSAVPKQVEPKPEEFIPSEHSVYLYRCFILQCLTELLMSYNKAKYEFIHFSRRAEQQSSTPSKHHSRVLQYLLQVLLPVGTVTATNTVEVRKRSVVSNWAINAIVALCSQTGEMPPKRKGARIVPEESTEPGLTVVRRIVLDHLLKSFKEAQASTDSQDHTYSRLLALGDLVNRLISRHWAPHPQSVTISNATTEQVRQVVKLMYEKNFAAVISMATTDIDLNFPNARRAVKYLLRPLKNLSEATSALASEGRLSILNASDHHEEESLSSSEVSDVSELRDETPDLYRNSTLGVLEPGDDDISDESGEMEDDEDQMYDEDYDDEMEYDDDEDDALSEDDTAMGPIEGLPADLPLNMEVVVNGSAGESSDELTSGQSSEHSDDLSDEDDMDDDDMDRTDDDMSDELDAEDIIYSVRRGMEDDGDGMVYDEDEDDWVDEEEYDDENDDDDHDHHPFLRPADSYAFRGNHNRVSHHDVVPVVYAPGLRNPHLHHHHHHHHSHHHDDDGMLHVDDEDEDDEIEDETYDDDMNILDNPGGYPPVLRFGPDSIYSRSNPPDMGSFYYHFTHGNMQEGRMIPEPSMFNSNPETTRQSALAHPLAPQNQNSGPNGGVVPMGMEDVFPNYGSDAMPGDFRFTLQGFGQPGENSMSVITNILNVLRNMQLFPPNQGNPFSTLNPTSFYVSVAPGVMDPSRALEISYPNNRADPETTVQFSPKFTYFRWEDESNLIFGQKAKDLATAVINRFVIAAIPFAVKHRYHTEEIRSQLRKDNGDEQPGGPEVRIPNRPAISEFFDRSQGFSNRLGTRDSLGLLDHPLDQVENDADDNEADSDDQQRFYVYEMSGRGRSNAEHGDEEDEEEAEEDQEDEEEEEEEEEENEAEEEGEDEGDDQDDQVEGQEPVYVTVRGREVDITGTNIDRDYLMALPDDLREEVVMQELSQRQPRPPPAPVAVVPDAFLIDPEFLDALPPSIRAEVLEQGSHERRRREREERRRHEEEQQPETGQPPATATGTTPVSRDDAQGFVHSLYNLLAGPDSTSNRPPDLPASGLAGLMGLDPTSHRPDDMPLLSLPTMNPIQSTNDDESAHKKQPRPHPQILDKSGVASLLRFMFIPMQGSARQSLDDIFRHICLHRPTRIEVLNNLLAILQDGSVDVATLDHSFSQLSIRAKSQPGHRSPHPSKRTPVVEVPDLDVSPMMVIQQCLRTLGYLCKENQRLCMFFFMENDHGGLRIKHNRKGKSSESKPNRYPINILIGLLDSPTIMESAPIIEQLASLLQYITIPLPLIFRKVNELSNQQADENVPAESSSKLEALPSAAGTSSSSSQAAVAQSDSTKSSTEKPIAGLSIPEIPEHNLRLVVTIIVTGECGPRAFRDTLSLATNLSVIPHAKEIFGQELLSHALQLGKVILTDLTQLSAQIDIAKTGAELHGVALAKFTLATADQAKLLRIFLSLDYLFDPRRSNPRKGGDLTREQENLEKDHILSTVYENTVFSHIWEKLSECLTKIRVKEMLNVATVLLPLIEVLMVICKNTTLKDVPLGRSESRDDSTAATPNPHATTGLERLFYSFTEEHRKVLNDLVRQNPKLMSGSFSLMMKNSKVLEFDNKRNFFNRELHKRSNRPTNVPATLSISIRRDQVFMDSFRSLNFKSADEIKYAKLNIHFNGEAGIDAGGVTREWFQVLTKQMFNPDYALFTHAAADTTIFHPNVYSDVNGDHLRYFTFVGRIIGKAIYEGRVLDAHFSRAVYKQMLRKSVALQDLESLDLDYYKSLVWMLENDITDVITETFSATSDKFGVMEETDLIPNGRNIPVTEENKHEYVKQIVQHKLVGAVRRQLDAFLKGFHEIIPVELISIFNEQELELLIAGLPDIDVDDWKNNSSYQNYSASSPQIQWFWRAVRSFDKEERAKLLQFITGTSKVPLNGFRELEGMSGFSKFTIHRDYGKTDRLPSAHTCFNQLDLPGYESYEKLRQQLYTAITAGSEYFGFA